MPQREPGRAGQLAGRLAGYLAGRLQTLRGLATVRFPAGAALFLAGAVLLLAGAVRVQGTSALRLDSGEVRPVSSDAHYYLRRIVQTYQQFPHVPDLDTALNCPDATVPPWPGGVERLGAGLAHLLLPAHATVPQVEQLAAWLPVASGVLAVAAVAWLGALWLGSQAGLLAGLLLALLPLHIWYTAFAFVDHHMLLTLWLVLLTWALDAVLHQPARRQIVTAGLLLGVGHGWLTEAWLSHVVLAAATVVAGFWSQPAGAERRQVLGAVVAAFVLAAVVALPAIAQAPYFRHGLVAPHAPSRFTLWLLAGLSAGLAAGWLALGPAAARVGRGALAALTAGMALLVLAVTVDQPMRDAVLAMTGFAGRAGMVATIEESKPFWRLPMPQPLLVLGAGVLLLPLLPVALGRLDPVRRRWLQSLYVATAALALLQTRFGLLFAVPYVLAWAAWLTGQLPGSRARRRLATAVGALLALSLLVPRVDAEQWSPHEESTWRMLRWMRDHLPPAAPSGDRCLLGPWDVGHKIVHVTGQPVIANNFTELRERDALRDALRVLHADDFAQAEPHLQRRNVRWLWTMATPLPVLVANAEELGLAPPTLAQARSLVGVRLLVDAGSARAQGEGFLAATGTLRRIHVSPLELGGLWQGAVAGPLRDIALFEHVRGAVLHGHATPGSWVQARLRVKHPGAPAFAFVQAGQAGADGAFGLRVPYASSGMPWQLASDGPWQVRVDGASHSVAVSESDVQAGTQVEVH